MEGEEFLELLVRRMEALKKGGLIIMDISLFLLKKIIYSIWVTRKLTFE